MDCALPIDAGCCGDAWAGYTPEIQERATALAWETLRQLTAGRVGNCPIVVRPCRQGCATQSTYQSYGVGWSGAGYTPFTPVLYGGQWLNIGCGCAGVGCSCTTVCEVVLPGEVASVESVTVDGITLDPLAYRIDNGNRLVRVDADCWPLCQDMHAPLTAAETFGVEYTPGILVNALGQWAAGSLACEYGLACSGQKCRLPANVTQVTRLGVSLTIQPGAFPGGMTGIQEVDTYVASLNPNRLTSPSTVWWPGRTPTRTTTWP